VFLRLAPTLQPVPLLPRANRMTIGEAPGVGQAPQHPLPNQIGEDNYQDWAREHGPSFADR
jgi:hypothetical protein